MKRIIVLFFVVCFLFQTAFLKKAEAGTGKLLLGIGLTIAGVAGISVGKEEYDIEFEVEKEVLDEEYDFVTYAEMGIWDDINSIWISIAVDSQNDPSPSTIVEKDKSSGGWITGTNDYDYWIYTEYNHHKVYTTETITDTKTEERTTTVGYAGYMATGIGVTLIIDYLSEKAKLTERTGIEVRITQKPGYMELALAKRF